MPLQVKVIEEWELPAKVAYPWISWSTCWCWGSQFLISVSRLLCKSVAAHVSHLFPHWLLAQHNRKWCSDAMLKCYNMLVSSCVGRKYYSYYKHQPSNMKTLHYAALLGRVLRIISKLLILPPLSDLSTLIMQQILWNLDQSHTAEIQGVS